VSDISNVNFNKHYEQENKPLISISPIFCDNITLFKLCGRSDIGFKSEGKYICKSLGTYNK